MTPQINSLIQTGQPSTAELDALSMVEIYQRLELLGQFKDTTRHHEVALHATLNKRFSDQAQQLRQAAGKSTGTVRFEVDGFVVIADLPKRPEYDQSKLKGAVEALRKWGENPDEYVGIEIKVSEAKYNAWPPAVRQLFEPARTLKVGKPTYKLELVKSDKFADAANDSNFNEVL
ncbi:hypothetical protein [Rhodoferax antarcticus]|uniref:hypothetical protein n=1 Tax=Rhodoferax antarcticus TaxID=81479 RepID=UPI002224416B|nr:hypothetical protein [Rhodoferax antarcticus]MCW2311471.1 hypothetical protein [Rhodoferax antarcticus]